MFLVVIVGSVVGVGGEEWQHPSWHHGGHQDHPSLRVRLLSLQPRRHTGESLVEMERDTPRKEKGEKKVLKRGHVIIIIIIIINKKNIGQDFDSFEM